MIFTDGVHLVSDESVQELKDFGRKIGLKEEWIQWPHNNMDKFRPHFDIFGIMVKRALDHGAVRVSSRRIVEAINRLERKQMATWNSPRKAL